MFNKILIINIILFYLISINVPLVYYAEHQINIDYIVKNLCEQKDEEENLCMGNCYLKKNLSKAEVPSKETEQKKLEIPASSITPHFSNKQCIHFNPTENKINLYRSNSTIVTKSFKTPDLQPPELLQT